MNTEWFLQKLAERRLSQRGLAKLMSLDPSAVSLMFRGKRKMTIQEAAQMAVLLDVPPTDVLTNAGVQLPPPAKMVPMIGYVVENDQVALLGEANHELIEGPGELQASSVCVRCQYGSNDLMDGWILFANNMSGSPELAIDTLAICAIKGNGMKVARIKRGYRRGHYNLLTNSSTMQNVELAWASPIVWIKTVA